MSSLGFSVFVRKEELSDRDWLELVELRREAIRDHLHTFTLPGLGSVECLRTEAGYTHSLFVDHPTVVNEGWNGFSLNTRGVFRPQPWQAVERFSGSGYVGKTGLSPFEDGMVRVWGLTQDGVWVVAEVNFVGEPGYRGRGYERATTVEIVQTDTVGLVAKTGERPQKVWNVLGEEIRKLEDSRRRLWEQARNLVRTVELEELVLAFVPGQ